MIGKEWKTSGPDKWEVRKIGFVGEEDKIVFFTLFGDYNDTVIIGLVWCWIWQNNTTTNYDNIFIELPPNEIKENIIYVNFIIISWK